MFQNEKVQKLKDLRDKSVFAFFMLNALFVLVVFLLTLKKDLLHVKWPFDVKVNFTYQNNGEVSCDIATYIPSIIIVMIADYYEQGVPAVGTDRIRVPHFLRNTSHSPVPRNAFPSIRNVLANTINHVYKLDLVQGQCKSKSTNFYVLNRNGEEFKTFRSDVWKLCDIRLANVVK